MLAIDGRLETRQFKDDERPLRASAPGDGGHAAPALAELVSFRRGRKIDRLLGGIDPNLWMPCLG
jgi:hypothetical protein